jgi:hypothetical protein
MREQLLLFVLLLFVLLFRSFFADLLRKRQRAAPREVEPEVSAVPPRVRTLPLPPAARPPVPRVGPRSTSLPAVGPPIAIRQRMRSRLGGLRDVRRGIVLMTILGPCRALELPGPPR